MQIVKAVYVKEFYLIVLHTTFVGPDGLKRSLNVSGIPDENFARAFLKHMGWENVEFDVVS